jgi:tripartite-type tricarboxylate transporter receptor subunit TctC
VGCRQGPQTGIFREESAMKLPRRRFLHLAAGAAALPAFSRVASAEIYPSRPVHWIVSFAAGGPNDIVARIIGQYLSEHLGQQFVIENRPGAGGNVGMQSVLSSAPDGYTIAFVGPNYAINPALYEKLPFDFIRDSVPVAGTMRLANVMEVHPAVPANNLAEFIAYAKANPGKINFASGGVGTSPHLSGELLKTMTGINLVHVPYRGTAPAFSDLLAGQVQVLFDNIPGSIGHIRSGKVRALGVTGSKRVAAIPDVPTIGETVPGYEVSIWYGIAAPRGTPPEIVGKLNQAVNAVLTDPKLQARLAELGGEPMPMTPAQFGKLVAEETERWGKLIRAANIKAE